MEKELTCLKIEPGRKPEVITINNTLEDLQGEVIGWVEELTPFREEVCIICNEERQDRREPNRAFFYPDGEIKDIVFGPFLIVGRGEGDEQFSSLKEEEIRYFAKMFEYPESFVRVNGRLKVIKEK